MEERTHQLFSNDTLLLGFGSKKEAVEFKKILNLYEKASRQDIRNENERFSSPT